MDAQELTSFDRLIAPKYVTELFWIGVAMSVLAGLGMILAGGLGVAFGLVLLVGGPVLTRVACEVLVLLFKAVDWIAEIKGALAKHHQAQHAARLEDGATASTNASPEEATEASPTDDAAVASNQ